MIFVALLAYVYMACEPANAECQERSCGVFDQDDSVVMLQAKVEVDALITNTSSSGQTDSKATANHVNASELQIDGKVKAGPCDSWCRDRPRADGKDWDQLCLWVSHCSGCDECFSPPFTPCKSWCGVYREWKEVCLWTNYCSGCAACATLPTTTTTTTTTMTTTTTTTDPCPVSGLGACSKGLRSSGWRGSIQHCRGICAARNWCKGFSRDPITGQCAAFQVAPDDCNEHDAAKSDWEYFSMQTCQKSS
eukprot:TRINITY_DN62817_c0_g1_i1.p1 TRINITY_DN62817_c0_g1~~TRINITY_DN62817_c0_g1_i1.p1  ORF type:complete len:250 (-),score=1.84 TRINITY_DN62817_c0_g1_i1:189-938(-)